MGTCNVTGKLRVDGWAGVRHDINSISISSITTQEKQTYSPSYIRKSETPRNPVPCWSVTIMWWSAGSPWSSRAPMPCAFCSTAPVLLALSFLQGVETVYLLKTKYLCPKEYYHLATLCLGEQIKLCFQAKSCPAFWQSTSWPEGHWFLRTLTLCRLISRAICGQKPLGQWFSLCGRMTLSQGLNIFTWQLITVTILQL